MTQTPPTSPSPSNTPPEPGDTPRAEDGGLKLLGGSRLDDWNLLVAKQLFESFGVRPLDDPTWAMQKAGAFAALVGIAPRDELESMMAAQLLAAHNAAMECYRRAMHSEQTFAGRQEALNQANKLSRTWATLLDTLNKHRGKGQQKVTVEHVHVHAGGQAVVGVVERPGPALPGGGVQPKLEEQAYARQIDAAPDAHEPALWGQDPKREPVPLAGDAERALPHARRPLDGSADGEP